VSIFEQVGTMDESRRVRKALAMLDAGTTPGGHVHTQ
jgi:hypothetical protein